MTSSDLSAFGPAGVALERTIRADRLSPSYLFEGSDSHVLREVAEAFAIAILAQGASAAERTRVEERVRRGDHPDLHFRHRDKPTVISVAALTETLEEAHGTPRSAPRQVFVIDPAEAMEPEGVARYLKALEEPPPSTVFLLLSTRPDRLPQTVLSRVRRLRVPTLPLERIAEELRADGEAEESAARLANWSGGSLTRARRLARAEMTALLDGFVASALDPAGRLASGADAALASLQRTAEAIAEEAGENQAARREHLRLLLTDLLHALATEARDLAAGRDAACLGGDRGPEAGLRLLERLGEPAAAVPANVTPAVIVLETGRILREQLVSRPFA